MNDIVVKKSKIHGSGVFAARDFKLGETVIKWSSHKILSKSDIAALSDEEKECVSFIDRKYVLVPVEGRVNHSCNPNVVLKNFCYVALKPIKLDEEITADYALESDSSFKMICKCKAKNCRKIIKK
jgi:SET domain-containing protein